MSDIEDLPAIEAIEVVEGAKGLERLLKPAEIAAALGVSPGAIYQWVTARTIPHVRVGSLIRFRASVINEWIVSRSVGERIRKTRLRNG